MSPSRHALFFFAPPRQKPPAKKKPAAKAPPQKPAAKAPRRLRPLEASKFSKIRSLDHRPLVSLASLVSSKKTSSQSLPLPRPKGLGISEIRKFGILSSSLLVSSKITSSPPQRDRGQAKPGRSARIPAQDQSGTHIMQTKRNLTVSLCCLHIVLNVSNQFRGEISVSHIAKIYQVFAFSKFFFIRAVTHQHNNPPKDNKV